jgi:DNA-binding LacI/PurR family transcriptional regulator
MSDKDAEHRLHRLPIYKQLANLLRHAVKEGAFSDGKVPAERELAQRYKISGRLASRAVDILVDEGLLYRIPRKGTYIVGTEGLRRRAARPIIYVSLPEDYYELIQAGPDLTQHFITLLRLQAEKDGYDVMVMPDSHEETWRFKTLASSPLMRGAVAFRHTKAVELRNALDDSMPVLCLCQAEDPRSDSVREDGIFYLATDNRAAGEELTGRLIRDGHQRILYIEDSASRSVAQQQRMEGYRSAMQQAGLTPTELPETPAGEEWAAHDPDGAAMILPDDSSAVLAMLSLSQGSFRVPQDVSLACFGDLSSLPSRTHPAISTMALPVEEMAKKGWQVLMQDDSPSALECLRYQFVARGSIQSRG